MTTRQKNHKARDKAGRPPEPSFTDRQRVLRNKLLLPLEPFVKGSIQKLASLAGVKPSKMTVEAECYLVTEEVGVAKLPSTTVQASAAKTILEVYREALKEVYPKDMSVGDPDETPEVPKTPTGNVRNFSMTLVGSSTQESSDEEDEE